MAPVGTLVMALAAQARGSRARRHPSWVIAAALRHARLGTRMTDIPANKLGDRVERAIERHADTPGEIERGEHEKPKRLRRNIVWLAVTGVSLYLVFPKVVDVFGSWRQITRLS